MKSDPLVKSRLASLHAKTDSMNTRLHRVEKRSEKTNQIYGDISTMLSLCPDLAPEEAQGLPGGDEEEDAVAGADSQEDNVSGRLRPLHASPDLQSICS